MVPQSTRRNSLNIPKTLRIFALAWAIVCAIIFMLLPGRVSTVQGSLLDNIVFLPSKLEAINYLKYLSDIIRSVFAALVVSCIYICAGSLIFLPRFKSNILSKNTQLEVVALMAATAFLIGHLIYSVVLFVLACYKFLTPFAVGLSWFIGLAVGLKPAFNLLGNPILTGRVKWTFPNKVSPFSTMCLLAILMLLTGLLLTSARLSYDSVYLYFSDPKATSLTASLHFFQGNIFVISSFQTAIHYAAIISIFGDQAARMYSWISGIIVIIFSLGIATQLELSKNAKLILVAMILTTTAFTDLMGDGKVDLTSTAVVLGAIFWMIYNEESLGWLLAGIFAGLAISSRIYNVFLLGVFAGLFIVFNFYRRKSDKYAFRNLLKTLAILGAGAVIPVTLNLIGNWAILGNALAMVSNVNGLPADKWQWAFDPRYIWLVRLLLPLSSSFLNTPQSLGVLTPLFLGFLPFLGFRDFREKVHISSQMHNVLVTALITLSLWIGLFFTVMEIRYALFLWIILYMPIAELIASAQEHLDVPFQFMSRLLLGFLLLYNIVRTTYVALDTYSPVDFQGNPHCENYFFCDFLNKISEEAPAGSRVLTLTAFRYYLRSDLLTCSTAGDEYQKIREASLQGTEAFWGEVYRQGYQYVAYENNYSVRHLYIDFIPDPNNTPAWMELEPMFGSLEDKNVSYKIKIISDPPINVEKECIQEHGRWFVEKVNP